MIIPEILKIARELNRYPESPAHALVGKRIGLIGKIIPRAIEYTFTGPLLFGRPILASFLAVAGLGAAGIVVGGLAGERPPRRRSDRRLNRGLGAVWR